MSSLMQFVMLYWDRVSRFSQLSWLGLTRRNRYIYIVVNLIEQQH